MACKNIADYKTWPVRVIEILSPWFNLMRRMS